MSREFSQNLSIGEKIILREKEGFKVALMSIESIWEPDFEEEANFVYGTKDKSHPAVNYLFHMSNKVYLGGKVEKNFNAYTL